jgi:hypothetical protein
MGLSEFHGIPTTAAPLASALKTIHIPLPNHAIYIFSYRWVCCCRKVYECKNTVNTPMYTESRYRISMGYTNLECIKWMADHNSSTTTDPTSQKVTPRQHDDGTELLTIYTVKKKQE